MFRDYLSQFEGNPNVFRSALISLFKILDTPIDNRDPYLDESLLAFPYVNGGLFSDRNVSIPRLSPEIINILLYKASAQFNWSHISPTIFGAVFESTLNPETRRSGGMHYTSIENIHKVIDPLFLDGLKQELETIKTFKSLKTRSDKLLEFQKKLATLNFLDPAAGSGNFLTETYLSLRRLENEVISLLLQDQMVIGEAIDPIKVSISQFNGIEINDFAVTVARTALWIAENQMMQETEQIIYRELEFLPLKTHANIVEGNALRINWEEVVPKEKVNFIMGNPPFSGARIMNKEQKADLHYVFKGWRNIGKLDYVSAWYKKSIDFMRNSDIETALVSTNSVSQGDLVGSLWNPLLQGGACIRFAHKTFRWDSEATSKAHVHCVIIGFYWKGNLKAESMPKYIYEKNRGLNVSHINPYLCDGPDVLVTSRYKPLCDVPEMGMGNQPIDDGNYLFTKSEMIEFLKKEPKAMSLFHPWYGSYEFIHNRPRYCLYLAESEPKDLRAMPEVTKRIESVRDFRLKSKSIPTNKLAETPTIFNHTNIPQGSFLVVPEASSERRTYIPIGFLEFPALCSNLVRIIPNASLYHFGILISNVHMAWMRAVAGRLKSDYRYSKEIVYNNFPWPEPNEEQEKCIEHTARCILEARKFYTDSSLADLYDPLTMPPKLLKAHQENDKAVMKAYGFDWRKMTSAECVAELLKMYQGLTCK